MTDTRSSILAGLRVLIVEDEFFLADDLKRALVAHGALVAGPVNSLDRARRMVVDGAVDLAVLDVNVKGEMIFPFAGELRDRGVPFIFTTGYDAVMIPADYRDVERWEKPFTLSAFVDALGRTTIARPDPS